MDHQFTRYWGDAPVEMPQLSVIRPAQAQASLAAAMPDAGVEAPLVFVNPESNSRIGVALGAPAQQWKLKWRTTVADIVQPSVLLVGGNRVLTYGMVAWELFDREGSTLRQGPLGASGVTLDPERSLFYAADQFGLIAARSMADGKAAFSMHSVSRKVRTAFHVPPQRQSGDCGF